MLPLTLEDLLPLDEYANRRREFFDSLGRYLDRYRRIRIGPKVTLLFENRQTLWFRVHEIIRITRLTDPRRLQQELEIYNGLLPGRERLQAALLIDIENEAQLTQELSPWHALHGSDIRLRIGDLSCPAMLITNRAADLCVGAAHWVQFPIDLTSRQALGDFRQPIFFEIVHTSYRHQSAPLSDDIRQSLVDDLDLSDRDAA